MNAGANSSTAIPPISNNPSAHPHSAAANQQQLSSSNTPVHAFISAISDNIRFGLANRRPWSELADLSAFSKPESLSEATLRLQKNYNYFRTKYLTIITAALVYLLLTNPFSFFLLSGLLAAWLFLIVFTLGVIFLTSVRSVLVSALMIGVAIVCMHGAFRAPEDLFINEQEPQSGVPALQT